ncbi:sensor histidine kinase [Pusillimonas sp. SM2304]|uniref:sensor histidine kinase n=1 Tax=Pusillimonas sp. SM2304 TaxID=3073241 RepID=UPI0028749164|nr:sensor histidine kinase [Pusillimonas sp. SM2304]MDS1138965.1 sensor histidine kinase [Pusillimonas sp. SM2304]
MAGKGEKGSKKQLFFDVSTGLKRVIGRDLITNDEVAVFELVKNSFDADATHVQLYFSNDALTVIDNGNGMSYEDLTEKWLFVAYSSKASPVDAVERQEFRQQISERKYYAGSKGIGRFSSDRLGSRLILQSKPASGRNGVVHQLDVDWSLFEEDQRLQFETVPVEYSQREDFDLPDEIVDVPSHGTVIKIENTRLRWDRDRILHLKAALAKLINPFGAETDGFHIQVIAPDQRAADEESIATASKRGEDMPDNALANGAVGNFIFSALKEKTTFIEVQLSNNGKEIISALTDRGELVYKVKEPNPYDLLVGSDFRCQLYYLNQSAKATFARRMGISSVQFGSVFLFRNGFRVYPIGEEDDDSFGIARRKQQGYARFLGTRDIIGRLDVAGTEEQFKESSSRNQGLVETPAAVQMRECFWEHCLKRLERYVVPVTWPDSAEKTSSDLSRLLTDSGRARVTDAVARLIDNPNVEVLDYSRKLVSMLNERSSQFEESVASLRAIALKTQDQHMLASLDKAERRFEELKKAEADAVRIAAEERFAKEAAQRSAEQARLEAEMLSVNLDEEKKRSLFLASITSLDVDTILNMHHQITIYAADLKQQVENCISAARHSSLNPDDVISRMESIAFLNQKVLSISRLAIKANFRLESDMIEADLADYIEDYIRQGAKPFLGSGVDLDVVNHDASLRKRFRPMEISIVIENLINNSRKAGATEVSFELMNPDKKTLAISVKDNGAGLLKSIDDPQRIFELGFSRTAGSGLGLYHVRQVLDEISGSIEVDAQQEKGTRFNIKVVE